MLPFIMEAPYLNQRTVYKAIRNQKLLNTAQIIPNSVFNLLLTIG